MNTAAIKTVKNTVLSFAFAGLLACVGCSKSGTEEPQPDTLKPGYMSGLVLDPHGKPLPGVTILADNTLLYNTYVETSSDAKGKYRVQTPNGSWRPLAQIRKSYNGKTYRLDLEPDNTAAFAGIDGAVRNFQWKLSGEHPEQSGLFYGGDVTVDKDIDSQLYDVENIEFTFTPVGPLVDGSAGKTLKMKPGEPYTEFYGRIPDVPIGRYKITAVHMTTGTKIKLRNKNGTYSADGSVTLDFYGETGPWPCTNCMLLEYTES